MGKTETIKNRAIYVYLPSLSMVEDWKRQAEKAGTSISKFVVERVEDSTRREDGEEGYLTRLDLIRRLNNAEEECKSNMPLAMVLACYFLPFIEEGCRNLLSLEEPILSSSSNFKRCQQC